MFYKKRFILINKITCLALVLFILIKILPVTYSKYESDIKSESDANIAFYVVGEKYQVESVYLEGILPRDEDYVYTFDVTNYTMNDDGSVKEHSEVDTEYTLSIIATTNLPLDYSLYKSDNLDELGEYAIESDDVALDEDNAYFRTITTSKVEMLYKNDYKTRYTLRIHFDSSYKDYKYQDIVEGIKIVVDSRQIIDG